MGPPAGPGPTQGFLLFKGSDGFVLFIYLFITFFGAGAQAKTEVQDNKDGTHTVTYVPLSSGMYTLLLRYGGQAVPGFPARVMVDPAVDTSKVRAFGPGLEGQGRVCGTTTTGPP